MAYTPGPWVVEVVGEHGYPQRVVANDDGLVLICETFYGPDAMRTPNLDLIAAAPDLLEALEELTSWASWASEELGGGHAGSDLVEVAAEAIAKARGES